MKIRIEMELDEELTDPWHPSGMTDDCASDLMDALSNFGQDIDIEKVK